MRDKSAMNDLGLPALSHWELFNCDLSAPGDWGVDEVKEVDCPECLNRFDQLRQRQIAAMTKRDLGPPVL